MIKRLFIKIKNKIKRHFEEILRIKTSPHSIALGFAIGSAIALFPTFGLGGLIGLLIVLIFERVSKLSLFAGLAFWNPLVLIPTYGLSYKIGSFLLKNVPAKTYNFWLFNQIFNYSKRFLLGNLILTITLTLLSYFMVFLLAKRYYKNYKPILEEISV